MTNATILAAIAPGASMEETVAGIKGYKFGDSTGALRGVEGAVRDSLGDANARKSIAAALTALLVSDATRDAKIFACPSSRCAAGRRMCPCSRRS